MAAVRVVQHHADANVVYVECPEVDRSKMNLPLVVAVLFSGEVAGELLDGSQRVEHQAVERTQPANCMFMV